jgi:hypothetical protein
MTANALQLLRLEIPISPTTKWVAHWEDIPTKESTCDSHRLELEDSNEDQTCTEMNGISQCSLLLAKLKKIHRPPSLEQL